MNVLFVLDALNQGGAEKLLLNVSERIPEGINISLITLKGGELFENFKKVVRNYYYLPRKKAIDFKVIKEIKKIINQDKIDIIHCHDTVSNFYSYLASKNIKKVKLIRTLHGITNTAHINNIIDKNIFKKNDYNLSVSSSFMQRIKRKFKNDLSNFGYLYNGIDIEKFNPTNKILRKEYSTDSSTFFIGMVGNFVKGKDQITLCKAMRIICESKKNVTLFFVGAKDSNNPNIYDNCVKYIEENNLSENVIFTGKRFDIPDVLDSLDIFVFSTLEDTFGIAVIEAMYIGVPCLLSETPEMVEISGNGKYATLFESKNENDLAQKILNIIEEKKKNNIDSKKYVEENFSINTHISNLTKIYHSVLSA